MMKVEVDRQAKIGRKNTAEQSKLGQWARGKGGLQRGKQDAKGGGKASPMTGRRTLTMRQSKKDRGLRGDANTLGEDR